MKREMLTGKGQETVNVNELSQPAAFWKVAV
jgi:hypothetical protein